MALGIDVGREGIDRVFRQEVVDVQFVDAEFGIVGHQFGCQRALGIDGDERTAFQLHIAFTFVQSHVGRIVRAVSFQSAVNLHPVRNTIGTAHLGVYQGYQEVQFLSLAFHLDVGLHTVDVCDILCLSFQ